jgi:hypothetical protein
MNEPQVNKWRDLVRPKYHYPDYTPDEDLSSRKNRKARRRGRRDWRAQDHAARRDWITQRREAATQESSLQSNPGCAGAVIVLALVIIVVGLVRGCGDQEPDSTPAPTISSTAAPSQTGAAPTPETTSSPTTAPVPTQTPAPVTAEDADTVMTQWATAWFTFTPSTGDDDVRRLSRAEPLMTAELARALWVEDPITTYYLDNNIDLTVGAVELEVPAEGTAPVDHDTRITRLATVITTYTAGPDTGQTFTSTYAVVVYRAGVDQPWLVGDFTAVDDH